MLPETFSQQQLESFCRKRFLQRRKVPTIKIRDCAGRLNRRFQAFIHSLLFGLKIFIAK